MRKRIVDGAQSKVCNAMIYLDGDNKYRVDRIIASKDTVITWTATGFKPQEIVVFLPEPPEVIIRDTKPKHTVKKARGVYNYSLFVKDGGQYYAVEGNSPPEMIIE
jgi:hypothetical protein